MGVTGNDACGAAFPDKPIFPNIQTFLIVRLAEPGKHVCAMQKQRGKFENIEAPEANHVAGYRQHDRSAQKPKSANAFRQEQVMPGVRENFDSDQFD
jgi:hypothetical protein